MKRKRATGKELEVELISVGRANALKRIRQALAVTLETTKPLADSHSRKQESDDENDYTGKP